MDTPRQSCRRHETSSKEICIQGMRRPRRSSSDAGGLEPSGRFETEAPDTGHRFVCLAGFQSCVGLVVPHYASVPTFWARNVCFVRLHFESMQFVFRFFLGISEVTLSLRRDVELGILCSVETARDCEGLLKLA